MYLPDNGPGVGGGGGQVGGGGVVVAVVDYVVGAVVAVVDSVEGAVVDYVVGAVVAVLSGSSETGKNRGIHHFKVILLEANVHPAETITITI